SSRRRHTRCYRDWSSDVCSSDLLLRHADPERLEVVDRQARRATREDARQLRPERDGPERGVLMLAVVLAVAVEPAVRCGLHARRAALHVVLRVEMTARRVRRADGVHRGQTLVVLTRLQGGEARVQPGLT